MSVEASSIRILDDRVVDQIAAGEVVERPASVVKELVENAVDAGATQIEVVLKDGGRALVAVADDGCGMGEQDALMALERHATSKIAGFDDLVGIRSFGFRGEALPSIAAVSKFELLTRRATDDDGTRIRVHGGKLVDVRPSGAAAGTQVRVRQLFYNLPARKAFLRQASTELGHCVQVVSRVALCRPDIGFTLQHGGRHLIDAPVCDDLAQRAADVLGPDARHLFELDVAEDGLRLAGLLSPPQIHRATGNGAIYSFVNGRWVRDLVLRRAIQQAYRDLTPRGRYPIVVLALDLEGNDVDVNVHPTKAEVHFRDPSGVGAFVARALRRRLLDRTGLPEPRPRHLSHSTMAKLPFTTPPMHFAPTPSPPVRDPDAETVDVPVPPPPEVAPVAAEPPATPLATPQPAPNGPSEPPELFGVIAERYVVGRQGGELYLLDVGRLARRLACLRSTGAGRPLIVPVVLQWREIDVRAAEYYAEELSRAGIEAAPFSPIELAVRALPDAVRQADVDEVVKLALQAARRSSSIRTTWGNRLPALRVPEDLAAVSQLIEDARDAEIPISPLVVDPLEVLRGQG